VPSSREFRFDLHPSGRVLWADRLAQQLDIQPGLTLASLCDEPAQLLRLLSAEGSTGPWAVALRGLEGPCCTWVWVERQEELLRVLGRVVSAEEEALCLQLQQQQEQVGALRQEAALQEQESSWHDGELARLERALAQATAALRTLHGEVVRQDVSLGSPGEVQPRWRARLAHELQTPLHSVSATTGVLLKEEAQSMGRQQLELLRQLQDSAEALAARVALQLLSPCSELGERQLRLRTFRVPELVSALRGMMRPFPVASGVELLFEEADVGELHTDEGRVLEVLRHYLTNALKCTQQGQICLAVRAVEPGLVLFSVADTGVGIEAEHQTKLFRACVPIDGPLRLRGLGLGLALVRRLAEQLGGIPLLTSAPGRGSRFYLSIPRVHPAQNSITMPTREGVDRSPGGKR
jgi:signal transduction histidine kinase